MDRWQKKKDRTGQDRTGDRQTGDRESNQAATARISQMDRRPTRQRDSPQETEGKRGRITDGRTDRQTNRQTDRKTDRQTDRQTDQADKHTDRQKGGHS